MQQVDVIRDAVNFFGWLTLQGYSDAGKIVCAGAVSDPVDEGYLIFAPETTDDEIRQYVESDPCEFCQLLAASLRLSGSANP